MNDPKINNFNKKQIPSPFVRMSGVFMQNLAQL